MEVPELPVGSAYATALAKAYWARVHGRVASFEVGDRGAEVRRGRKRAPVVTSDPARAATLQAPTLLACATPGEVEVLEAAAKVAFDASQQFSRRGALPWRRVLGCTALGVAGFLAPRLLEPDNPLRAVAVYGLNVAALVSLFFVASTP